MSWLDRLLCAIGVHGPFWVGWRSSTRSSRTSGFERTCEVCGAVWHGTEIETPYTRSLGNWRRVK